MNRMHFTVPPEPSRIARAPESEAADPKPQFYCWNCGAPLNPESDGAYVCADCGGRSEILRRHDDLCPIKRARWQGGAYGWITGVLTTLALLVAVGRL